MPVRLLWRIGLEMVLIGKRIRRLLLEPGAELGNALRDALVFLLIDHAGHSAGPRLNNR
jgi:hypothetical protein